MLWSVPVFIYSMPGYKCPIKERMLYSSCKGPFVSQLEQQLQLPIEKKVGWTLSFLFKYVHSLNIFWKFIVETN